jgi:hypothetical protein
MFFFEQLLYEQEQPQPEQVPNDFSFREDELEQGDGEDITAQDSSSSLIPIKRYFLIQKLFALNDKLNQLRIKNDILNLVITFVDSFSYESLLSLSNKIAEEIYLQVKTNDTEDTKNQKKLETQ